MVSTSTVDQNAALGAVLVTCAGLATGLGASAVFFKRLVELASKRVLAVGIGLSAGVMLYVSFVEIFQKSLGAFLDFGYAEHDAYLCATICFFSGAVLMKAIGGMVHLLDRDEVHHGGIDLPMNELTPGNSDQGANGDSAQVVPGAQKECPTNEKEKAKKLQRMGINTALAIAIHNFPEGLATFVGTMADPHVGLTLAVAIAIHNIPEGLCVALPIFYARGSRMQAFCWALLSGLSEPLGAAIGYAILKSTGEDMNQLVYGALFGLVAGMMVAIVLVELLPTAHRYDPDDTVVNYSVFTGMVIMALSLVLFMY